MAGSDGNNMSDLTNIEDVLKKIGDALTINSSTSNALSVGFFSDYSQKTLEKIIIDAIRNRKDSEYINNLTKNIIQFKNDVTKQLDDKNPNTDSLLEQISKTLLKMDKEKNDKSPFVALSKKFAKIQIALEVLGKIGKSFIDRHVSFQNNFRELYNSGIILEDGMRSIGYQASKAGFIISDFVELMKDNSSNIRLLNSRYGEGNEQFVNIIGKVREFGDTLLWDSKVSAKVVSSFMSTQGYYQKTTNDLIDSTITYMKQLNMLSKATGKTVEQLEDEEKARKSNVKYNLLIEQNAEKKQQAMILENLFPGLDKDDIVGLLTNGGLPTESLAKIMAIGGRETISMIKDFTNAVKIRDEKERYIVLNELKERYKGVAGRNNAMVQSRAAIAFYDSDYANVLNKGLMNAQAVEKFDAKNALFSSDEEKKSKDLKDAEDFAKSFKRLDLQSIMRENNKEQFLFNLTGGAATGAVVSQGFEKVLEKLTINDESGITKNLIQILATNSVPIMTGILSLTNISSSILNKLPGIGAKSGTGTSIGKTLFSGLQRGFGLYLAYDTIESMGKYAINPDEYSKAIQERYSNESTMGNLWDRFIHPLDNWGNIIDNVYEKYIQEPLTKKFMKEEYEKMGIKKSDEEIDIEYQAEMKKLKEKKQPAPSINNSDKTSEQMKINNPEKDGYIKGQEVIYDPEIIQELKKMGIGIDNLNSKMELNNIYIKDGNNARQLNSMTNDNNRAENN